MSPLESQIIDLQTRVAFQEQTIDALDKALQSQQLQIIALEKQLTSMKEEMVAMQNSPDFLPAEQEPPPPHY